MQQGRVREGSCFRIGGGIVEFMAEMLIERWAGQRQAPPPRRRRGKVGPLQQQRIKVFCNFKKVASGQAKWKRERVAVEQQAGIECDSCVQHVHTHTRTAKRGKVAMKTLLSNVCRRFKQFRSRQPQVMKF